MTHLAALRWTSKTPVLLENHRKPFDMRKMTAVSVLFCSTFSGACTVRSKCVQWCLCLHLALAVSIYLPVYRCFAAHIVHVSKDSPGAYKICLVAATAAVSPVTKCDSVLPSCLTGEGMLEHGPDRHEQLKLRAQKQGLLEGNSAQELPACCSIDTADESGDDQEDLDALTY